MPNETHDLMTASDRANREADRDFKACLFDEAVRKLTSFLDAHRAELPAAELLRAHANLAAFERGRGDYRKALKIHEDAAALLEVCHRTDPLRCGMFSNGFGATYLKLTAEDPAHEDRAIFWFTAASVYYEAAGEWGMKRDVENNLAVLHAEAGRVTEAWDHLANVLGCGPMDEAVRGQVEDTQALIALKAGAAGPAVDFSYSSMQRLRRVGDERLLTASVRTLVRAGRAYLRELEERGIRGTLEACGWNLTRAARRLGFNSREALTNHIRRNFPRLNEERRNRSVTSPGAE